MSLLSTILLSEIASGNQEFADRLLPHLKPEFFNDKADRFDRTIFKILCEHRERYNAPSTLEQAQIALQKLALDDSAFAKATEQLANIYEPQPPRQFEWLKDKVIEYVRERLYNIAQDAAENAREKRKDPRPHIEAALEALVDRPGDT